MQYPCHFQSRHPRHPHVNDEQLIKPITQKRKRLIATLCSIPGNLPLPASQQTAGDSLRHHPQSKCARSSRSLTRTGLPEPLLCRKKDPYRGSLSYLAVNINSTAVSFDDFLTDD